MMDYEEALAYAADDYLNRKLAQPRKLTEEQREVRRRSRKVSKKLGIPIPKAYMTDIHRAVAYCHGVIEERRRIEQAFEDKQPSSWEFSVIEGGKSD